MDDNITKKKLLIFDLGPIIFWKEINICSHQKSNRLKISLY